MQGRQRNGIFSAVGIQGPELAQPSLTPLSDRGLRHQPAEDQLPGRIKPVSRQPWPGTTGMTVSDASDLRPRAIGGALSDEPQG
jgi:hypothetical protein